MAKYLIEGGNKLSGRVAISGNKNAALPCLAACLLTSQEVVLHNIPQILDVVSSLDILKELGAQVDFQGNTARINCKAIKHHDLPESLANKLRASLLFVGPLLARFGKVEFPHPGGCVIGKRGIDLHLSGFQQLGYTTHENNFAYKITRNRVVPSEVHIFLDIATVTGTENLILASVIRDGKTVIRNAAQEPHVVDLCRMLTLMGAKIYGIGTSTLTIEGVKELSGTEFTISPDHIEFGTYAIAAGLTGGEVELVGCQTVDSDPVIWPMMKMGLSITPQDESIKVTGKKFTAISPKLVTGVWPGFPTDLMSAMIVLSTQAKGVSLLHDWIFESRMFFVDKLITMGANITIADPHRVIVSGPSRLQGKKLESPDLRAGMALVLAALVAEGQSVIDRAELIERGYEDVVVKLASLGAKIQRIDN